MFKIGDKVRVITNPTRVRWNSKGYMECTIGKVGLVTYSNTTFSIVQFSKDVTDRPWQYFNEDLEKASLVVRNK